MISYKIPSQIPNSMLEIGNLTAEIAFILRGPSHIKNSRRTDFVRRLFLFSQKNFA
jgi:hypothetical protein